MGNNLVCAIWSYGTFKLFSGTETVYEGSVSNDVTNEQASISN